MMSLSVSSEGDLPIRRTRLTLMPSLAPTTALDDDGDALPAADARRADGELLATTAQLVDEVRRDARARRAERVAERDRAAVDVGPLAVEAELLLDGEVLRRERLVDLDEIDVADLEPRAVQRAADRRRRADAHDLRIAAGDAPLRERRAASSRTCWPASFEQTTSAAAPSQMPDALPAVTTPSFLKTGGSLASVSSVVCGRGCSSTANCTGPFFDLSSSGAISSLKRPPSFAAAHAFCERSAYSSHSWRVIPYCSARFSAVIAIGMPV